MWMPKDEKKIKQYYDDLVARRTSYSKIGRECGVSDNAVRKRFKTRGRELPKIIRGTRKYKCDYCGTEFIDDASRERNSRHGNFYCNNQCRGYASRKLKNNHLYND